MNLIFLLSGLVSGFIFGWVWSHLKRECEEVSEGDFVDKYVWENLIER